MRQTLHHSVGSLLRAIYKKTQPLLIAHVLSGILMLGTTGCTSTYRESFDCVPGRGVGCQSITQVNRLVDQSGDSSLFNANQADDQNSVQKDAFLASRPISSQSHSLKVWIAPYKDEHGNLHGEQTIQTRINSDERG